MQPPDGKAALVYTTKEDLAKTLFLKLLCSNLPPKFRMVFLGLPSALSRQSRDDPDRPDSNLSSQENWYSRRSAAYSIAAQFSLTKLKNTVMTPHFLKL